METLMYNNPFGKEQSVTYVCRDAKSHELFTVLTNMVLTVGQVYGFHGVIFEVLAQ